MPIFKRKTTGTSSDKSGDNKKSSWKKQAVAARLVRGFQNPFGGSSIPPKGTVCPVCLVEPETRKDWFVATIPCKHAICKDCLAAYAARQLKDPDQTGPRLKCWQCSLHLTTQDSLRALAGDESLIAIWELKVWEHNIQSFQEGNYHHCPRCTRKGGWQASGTDTVLSGNANTEVSNMQDNSSQAVVDPLSIWGGGYVTQECLNSEGFLREEAAEQRLNSAQCMRVLLNVPSCCIVVSVINDNKYIRTSTLFFVFFWSLWMCQYRAATRTAKQILFQVTTVGCPYCEQKFTLRSESDVLPHDAATAPNPFDSTREVILTQEWIDSNTRPCPSCSVPISRQEGGCNLMRCTYCRAWFCWHCMIAGSACGPFNCNNGAPYGDADARINSSRFAARNPIFSRIARMERKGGGDPNIELKAIILLYACLVSVVIDKYVTGSHAKKLSRPIDFAISCAFLGHFIMRYGDIPDKFFDDPWRAAVAAFSLGLSEVTIVGMQQEFRGIQLDIRRRRRRP